MSEHDYANVIEILKNRLKHFYSFVESIEVFQYYPPQREGWPKIEDPEHAKKQVIEFESAIKRLKEKTEVAEWIRGDKYW